MSNAAIWWIRRDVRLSDNGALRAALAHSQAVAPLFILDPAWLEPPAEKRQAFLWGGLRRLDADLQARGGRLIVRRGRPLEALAAVLAETGAQAIFAEEDYTPDAWQRDAEVSAHLPLQLVPGVTVRHPMAVLKPNGQPYTVFTPYSRAWKAQPLPRPSDVLPPPERVPITPAIALAAQDSLLPAADALAGPLSVCPFDPGEAQAQRRLQAFVSGPIFAYSEGRNRLDVEGTAGLSPYLRFGMASARQAVTAAQQALESAPDASARQGAQAWLDELIWREFYMAILYHFPHVLQQAFRADLRDIAWRDDPDELAAWREGRTGYPVVDAAMRQLAQTGWMHNRARMIVASFLVKDLLVDWRQGEQWFMRHLVDGDPAANNGGWQWTAGVGTDAAPYFRIFNPVLQSARFDPAGVFIRRWLPELAAVPTRFIHAPWTMPDDAQRQSGCVIGRAYPAPLVERALARQRALAAYGRAKTGRGQG